MAQTFTYGIEDQAWMFDPKPMAPVGSPAPSTPYKALRAFGGASASSDVTLRAVFDNVAVNGSVSVTRTLNVLLAGTGTGTVTSGPAGISCPGDCQEAYSLGSSVTLTADASSGSSLAGWSGCDVVNANTCTVTMDAAKTVTATFAAGGGGSTYPLTVVVNGLGVVTSDPAGIDCPGTCSATFASGTVVTLTASTDPFSGFVFGGWGGSCAGTGTCTFTLTQEYLAGATFVTPAALGTITGTVSYEGSQVGTIRIETQGVVRIPAVASGGTYSVVVPAVTGYSVRAWVDVNNDGAPDYQEDSGSIYPITVSAEGTTTANVTIQGLPGSITGRVVKTEDSGQGISGAVIGVHSGPIGWGAVSGPDGSFTMGLLPMGTYTLRATAEGRVPTFYESSPDSAGADLIVLDQGAMLTGRDIRMPAAPSFSLTVTISGSGSVTDGGSLNCSGTCTATYFSGTIVTLTPQGHFVGWGGTCPVAGPTCIVTMDASKNITAAFVSPTTPPTSFSPYDDFSSPRLDPARWASPREQVREIRDGELVLALGGTLPPNAPTPVNIQLRRVNLTPPPALTALQADLRLTAYTPPAGGRSRLALRGTWYNADYAEGEDGDGATGDVRGGINLHSSVTGLGIVYRFFKCMNATCSTYQDLEGETLVAAANLDRTYTVGMTYSGSLFTFTVDGVLIASLSPTLAVPLGPPKQGEVLLRAELQCQGDPPTCDGGPGYVAGAFDNVTVNGTLFEDFTGPWIDRSKWAPGEIGSEVRSDELAVQSYAAAGYGGQLNTLGFANPGLVTALAADVVVNTLEFSNLSQPGYAAAGLRGRFYSTQSAPTSADNDVIAEVYYAPDAGDVSLYFQAYRAPSAAPRVNLALARFAQGIFPGQSHRLFLVWDPEAKLFTFGYDENAWTYDPTPFAPVGNAAPYQAFKGFLVSASGSSSSSTYLQATYDNVEARGAVINTQTGSGVSVQPVDAATGATPVALTFPTVTQSGVTTLTTSNSGPEPPAGFGLGDPPRYYELATTAAYVSPITVCINYTGISYSDEASLKLIHFEGGNPIDCTTSLHTTTKTICGQVASLSPFAVVERVVPPDTTPPTISAVTASPDLLWPPNHKLVPVTLAISVSDIGDPAPTCQIISVTSNEPVDGLGDGDTAPDWVITGNRAVNLRAERAGAGTGREYTIAVRCTDAAGNSSTSSATVTVPHDRRK